MRTIFFIIAITVSILCCADTNPNNVADNVTIIGKVFYSSNEPICGCTIDYVNITDDVAIFTDTTLNNYVFSDKEGAFSLQVPRYSVLRFRAVGAEDTFVYIDKGQFENTTCFNLFMDNGFDESVLYQIRTEAKQSVAINPPQRINEGFRVRCIVAKNGKNNVVVYAFSKNWKHYRIDYENNDSVVTVYIPKWQKVKKNSLEEAICKVAKRSQKK